MSRLARMVPASVFLGLLLFFAGAQAQDAGQLPEAEPAGQADPALPGEGAPVEPDQTPLAEELQSPEPEPVQSIDEPSVTESDQPQLAEDLQSAEPEPAEQAEPIEGTGQVEGEVVQQTPPPRSTRSSNDAVTRYLDAITEAEAIGGSYAAELGDLYLGLGKSLIEVGDLEEAREAFQQGVMVARVNYGPNSIEQANYLYSIADIEAQVGDLESANRALQNIYLINVHAYGDNNPALLPALEKMYAWYFDPQTPRAASRSYSDFQNGGFLARRVADLTETQNGLGDERTAWSYRTLGQLQFEAIRFLARASESGNFEINSTMDWSEDERRQEAYLFNHYRDGADAFLKSAESWKKNPEATDLQRAEALAQVGDWYLIFSKPDTAQGYYRQAYELLANSPEFGHLADDYMGQPTPVRFMNPHDDFVRDINVPYPPSGLELKMTVTRTGDLHDIKVLNAQAGEEEKVLRVVRREMRSTRFRPGLINGKMEKFEDFFYRVAIVPKETAG